MTFNLRIQLAVTVLLIPLIAGLVTVLSHPDKPSPRKSSTALEGFIRPSIPTRDFTLTDQDNHSKRLSNYRGNVVVISFVYSTCQDTCPIMAQQIRGALDTLGSDVPVLLISVDPANDTSQTAKQFLTKQRLTNRASFLLGKESQLRPVWKQFGIAPQRDGRDHSAYVVLLDRLGRQRVGFPADQLTPNGLAHDIRILQSRSPAKTVR